MPLTFPLLVLNVFFDSIDYNKDLTLLKIMDGQLDKVKYRADVQFHKKKIWYSLFRGNASQGAICRIFTVAFFLFLAPAGPIVYHCRAIT